MQARVTAHRGILVVELVHDPVRERAEQGQGPSNMDRLRDLCTVIRDTGKYLGVSAEALMLLRKVKRGIGRIGDFAWYRNDDGKDSFAWMGGPKRLINPEEAETAREYAILAHRIIANEVPEGARKAIDANF